MARIDHLEQLGRRRFHSQDANRRSAFNSNGPAAAKRRNCPTHGRLTAQTLISQISGT
jgi:hypothetical protein